MIHITFRQVAERLPKRSGWWIGAARFDTKRSAAIHCAEAGRVATCTVAEAMELHRLTTHEGQALTATMPIGALMQWAAAQATYMDCLIMVRRRAKNSTMLETWPRIDKLLRATEDLAALMELHGGATDRTVAAIARGRIATLRQTIEARAQVGRQAA